MASGDTLLVFSAASAFFPATNFAALDMRNRQLVLDFDPATDEACFFSGVLPAAYSGGGLIVRLIWAASTATSGNVVWLAAFARLNDEGQDIDSDGFASDNSATAAAPGTSGQLQYTDISFTDGVDMDSLLAEEAFRLRITRDADNASDTMTGDAELLHVVIEEI